MSGPHRDRWNPTSPKANPHWMRLYAAKRRALDRQILAEAERAIGAEEAGQRATMGLVCGIMPDGQCPYASHPSINCHRDGYCWLVKQTGGARRRAQPFDIDARAAIARAFGRPPS